MQKVVLVIPCFNEEQRLDRAEFLRLASGWAGLELLFVDDGSRDRTADVIRALQPQASGISLRQLPSNFGKAEAVREGMRAALQTDAEFVGYIDADLATPVDEVLRLVRLAVEGKADAILASRVRLLGTSIARRPLRHYLGRIFATVASLALRLPVYDTQCGAKLFRRTPALAAALALPFRSRWAFDVELLGRLTSGSPGVPPLAVGALVEVPLRAWRDVGGSSMHLRAMLLAGVDLLLLFVRSRVRR